MEDLRTKLIIIQPTSFCNLNCRYCYVPFRQDHNFMSDEVLDSAIKLSLESPFLQNEVEFLYHAGEPLTVGIDFYKKAMQFIERYNSKNINVINNIQTNGVLLNDKWCTFLKDYHFKVGISIDGPEFLHDKNRKNWAGQGSFQKALKGFECAKAANLDVGILTVLTLDHLSYPDEMFQFYLENKVTHVGFNVEEIENMNHVSSLKGEGGLQDSIEKYNNFMKRMFDLWWQNNCPFVIREFSNTLNYIFHKKKDVTFQTKADESTDLAIITIQKNGDVTTYAPEFAGFQSPEYNNFVIGNVRNLASFAQLQQNEMYCKIKRAIDIGKKNCSQTCVYYDLCGSSFISNRYTETGKLENTESMGCLLHKKLLTEIVVDKMKGISLQACAESSL